MGEPAGGLERTSTFADMRRAETSRRGGCSESRAMDRRGQASAAINCLRCRSEDRAVNGCAIVLVGRGAYVGLRHGGQGGGRIVAGAVHRRWRRAGERTAGSVGRVLQGGGGRSPSKRSRPGGCKDNGATGSGAKKLGGTAGMTSGRRA